MVTAGLAIYDTMQYIRCPVGTLAVGQAASMASLLLAAGQPGQRRTLPHRWVCWLGWLHTLCVCVRGALVCWEWAGMERWPTQTHTHYPPPNQTSLAPPPHLPPLCSRVMLHQPSGGASGQASDIAIAAKEILKMRDLLNGLYVRHTGQTPQRVGERWGWVVGGRGGAGCVSA